MVAFFRRLIKYAGVRQEYIREENFSANGVFLGSRILTGANDTDDTFAFQQGFARGRAEKEFEYIFKVCRKCSDTLWGSLLKFAGILRVIAVLLRVPISLRKVVQN